MAQEKRRSYSLAAASQEEFRFMPCSRIRSAGQVRWRRKAEALQSDSRLENLANLHPPNIDRPKDTQADIKLRRCLSLGAHVSCSFASLQDS